MKVLLILFFSALSLLLYAQTTIDLANAIRREPKVIMLSEIASDIRYIPLETGNNFLISDEHFISLMNNEIIVAEHRQRAFFRFNENGKFLNQIGRRGQGPEEYNVGLFFMIDPLNNDIYVQDFGHLIRYDKQGRFISRIPTPNLNMGASAMLNNEFIVYSNNLYFENRNNPVQLYVIDKNGRVRNTWQGSIERGRRHGIILSSRDFFYTFNGNTFFKPALRDVVYKIETPRRRTVAWRFDKGNRGINVSANETNPNNRGRFISILQIKETERFLFVLYSLERNLYFGMYDKQSGQFNNVIIKDDLAGGFNFIHAGQSADNQLMNVRLPHRMLEMQRFERALLPHRRKELDDLLKNMTEDDNPIVIKVTLK